MSESIIHDSVARAQMDLAKARAMDLWGEAVVWLRDGDGPYGLLEDARALCAEDPERWMSPYHFTTGMTIRNMLRKEGYGEAEFGIDNLDNVYVELIEEAAGC